MLRQDKVGGQRAINAAAKCGITVRRRPIDPVAEKAGDYAVAHLEASDFAADRKHFARAIGTGNTRPLNVWHVGASYQHQVALIQRDRTNCDQHVARAGLWNIDGVEGKGVEGEFTGETECFRLHAGCDAEASPTSHR